MEGPVLGELVAFFGVFLDGLDDALESLVLADELKGCRGTNLGNGIEVVATEENAEVDKLVVDSRKLEIILEASAL